jgi:hypothetical protein
MYLKENGHVEKNSEIVVERPDIFLNSVFEPAHLSVLKID